MGQYTQAIQNLYVAYLARPADPGGVQYWGDVATRTNGDFSAIRNAFSHSAEYQTAYANKSNADVVDQVYINLFGRHAEAGGLVYWSHLLDQHAITVDNVVEAVAGGAQGSDFVAFNRKGLTATLFTNALDFFQGMSNYVGENNAELGRTLLRCVTDDASYQQVIAPHGKLDMLVDMINHPGMSNVPIVPTIPIVPAAHTIAIGEPNPMAAPALLHGSLISTDAIKLTGLAVMPHDLALLQL